MTSYESKNLFIRRYKDYILGDSAMVIYNTRLAIIEDIDYIMTNITNLTTNIVRKYNPDLIDISTYLENMFNKKFNKVMQLNFTEPSALNEKCLYLTAYVAKYKNNLLLAIEQQSNEYKDFINIRKKDNRKAILNAYRLLTIYYPSSIYISYTLELLI